MSLGVDLVIACFDFLLWVARIRPKPGPKAPPDVWKPPGASDVAKVIGRGRVADPPEGTSSTDH